MKKILVAFVILVAVALGAFVFTSRNTPLGAISNSDTSQLERLALKFFEDLRFKDFQHAASYHSSEERKKVNIPKLIEDWFAIKPEQLDIMRYDVQKVDIDSTGNRGKVKVKAVIKILNTDEIRQPEVMLYWFKDPTEGWVMELESSLH